MTIYACPTRSFCVFVDGLRTERRYILREYYTAHQSSWFAAGYTFVGRVGSIWKFESRDSQEMELQLVA